MPMEMTGWLMARSQTAAWMWPL